jgi:hypothetical protein
MELTTKQKKIIFNAVRNWQMNKVPLESKDYKLCSEILDTLFKDVYTQQQEQPT